MGGNVKAAMTETPSKTLLCEICSTEFTRKGKHATVRVCKSCRKRLNSPENVTASLALDLNTSPQELTVEVTLETTVHDDVRIDLPSENIDDEEVVGVIRIENADETIWYEDALVTSTFHGGVSVKGSARWELSLPDAAVDSAAREQYHASVGELFDADDLTVTVQFTSGEIASVKETIETPTHMVDF